MGIPDINPLIFVAMGSSRTPWVCPRLAMTIILVLIILAKPARMIDYKVIRIDRLWYFIRLPGEKSQF